MLRLYDYVLSADCYTVRVMLGLLGLTYETVPVDFYPGREHQGEAFRRINPRGTIPVLEDGDIVLGDVADILRHLAQRYDPSLMWLPVNGRGLVEAWVAFARTDLVAVEEARLMAMTGGAGDLAGLRRKARLALRVLEDRLSDRTIDGSDWLVRETSSLADIAAFPMVALSHDAEIGLEDFPALNLWQRRIRKLPGFVSMPGIPDYF